MDELSEGLPEKPEIARHVTVVVTRTVQAGAEDRYLDWATRVIAQLSAFPGYLGATVLTPPAGQHNFHLVYHFATAAQLDAWETSGRRAELLAEAEDFSYVARQKGTGLEAWFELPGQDVMVAPRRWKQAVLTVMGVFPLSLLFSTVVTPRLHALPKLITTLIISILLVAMLTWVVMPRLSRLAARWLYR